MKPGYLTLTRRVGERIFIGKDIEILVSRISGGQVKIAISAPENLRIERDDGKRKSEKDTSL